MTDSDQARRDRAKSSKPWWRRPTPAGASRPGSAKRFIFAIALAWSLFQLWYASPLPYHASISASSMTARRASIHLALRVPAGVHDLSRAASRRRATAFRSIDWVLAALGVAAALLSARLLPRHLAAAGPADHGRHRDLGRSAWCCCSRRRGAPSGRRSRSSPALMLVYIFAGPWLPGLLAHKGASLSRAASQMWLTSEGHLRRRARRLDQLRVLLRAVRQPAGEGRRRKLFHPARLLDARHSSAAGRPRPASSPPA